MMGRTQHWGNIGYLAYYGKKVPNIWSINITCYSTRDQKLYFFVPADISPPATRVSPSKEKTHLCLVEDIRTVTEIAEGDAGAIFGRPCGSIRRAASDRRAVRT